MTAANGTALCKNVAAMFGKAVAQNAYEIIPIGKLSPLQEDRCATMRRR